MQKRLYTLKEFSECYSMGMTKSRKLAKQHEADFVVRSGVKILIDIQKFEKYMDRCQRFGIPIV